MGLLKFTKSYSASDDGSTVTGSNLGTVQADIAAILNGGISNVNVASDAAIAESKILFNTTSGHDHDGTDSKLIDSSSFILRSSITDAVPVFVSTTTVKVTAGVLDIDGTLYSRTADSTTLNITTAAHYIGGVSQRGTSKWLHIYAYNDATTSWDVKLFATSPQYSNCGTSTSGALKYREVADVWYRYLGSIWLNATGSGEIEAFDVVGNSNTCRVVYDATDNFHKLTNGSSTTFADVDCSSSAPPNAIAIDFIVNGSAGNTLFLRKNGSSSTNGIRVFYNAGDTVAVASDIPCDTSQIVEYKGDGAGISHDLYTKGYTFLR